MKMSTTQNLFEQAQLAEAAYANFIGANGSLITNNDAVILALRAQDFSESQATEFVKHWKVVSHIPNQVPSGFSATVFEKLNENGSGTGEYSLAIRGSLFQPSAIDFIADAKTITTDGVAVSQLVDMYNYWQSLTHNGAYQAAKLVEQVIASTFLTAVYTANGGNIAVELIAYATGLNIPTTYDGARAYFISQGYVVEGGTVYDVQHDISTNVFSSLNPLYTGNGSLIGETVSLSGHSLGGHLGMAFSRLFPSATNDVTSINGLGFKIGDANVNNHTHSAWLLSQSCNAASIRVCQPVPVARKLSTTVGDSRIVIRSFVGASCAPRTRRASLFCNVSGNAENGSAFLKSSVTHSGLSSSIKSGFSFLLILFHLTFIRSTKTDDADAIIGFRKHQRMQALMQIAKGTNARFAIFMPCIYAISRCFKIKINHPLKRQPAQFNIKRIFSGVESDLHNSDCMYKITGSQAENDKTIISHINILNKQACDPHGYWLAGLHWNALARRLG
jgi:hypothetical protein